MAPDLRWEGFRYPRVTSPSERLLAGRPLARIHRGGRLVSILKWPEGAPLNLG